MKNQTFMQVEGRFFYLFKTSSNILQPTEQIGQNKKNVIWYLSRSFYFESVLVASFRVSGALEDAANTELYTQHSTNQ
jgi:hypothetical protein